MAESLDVKMECAARHEPGHLVVAAVQGLRLKPEGLILDSSGEGLACYCRQPDGSDLSRKQIISATFAGYYAERHFRNQHDYAVVDPEYWFANSFDGREARGLLSEISTDNLSNGSVPVTQAELQAKSEQMVEQHWEAIDTLARALLAKPYETWRPLKSGARLSQAATARYLSGEEVGTILARFGILAEVEL